MATNPMLREGCWLCAGSGEVETRKADESYEDVTVGCPVCVQNDHEWWREEAVRQRDQLAEALQAVMEYGNSEHMDRRAAWAMGKARVALKAMEEE